jgi:hypothetical protein
MFKKIKELLAQLKLEQRQRKCIKEAKFKCYRKFAYNSLRDKCIEYVCKRDIASGSVELPATHKVDIILPNIIKSNKDIFNYNKKFPYRLVNRELVRLEECYSY